MRQLLRIVFSIIIFNACNPEKQVLNDYTSDILKIKRISEHVFQHTSYLETKSFGNIPCNGMIYFNGNEVIIFDTPTNNKASSELINWVGNNHIKAIVITHFHIDCLGGLGEFHVNGIKSYATSHTIKLAKEAKKEVLPQNDFNDTYKFQIGNEIVLAKYFGQGHTKDNIIGYIPSEKTLFGGCLIKSLDAPKGNLSDANTSEWSLSVENIKNEWPYLTTVIPGHGKRGGIELLDYTIELFKEN